MAFGDGVSIFLFVTPSDDLRVDSLDGDDVSDSADAYTDDLLNLGGDVLQQEFRVVVLAFNCIIDVESFEDLIGILLMDD